MLKADLDDSVSELGTVCDVSQNGTDHQTQEADLTCRNTILSSIIYLPCTARSN